jgi:hypothetical protein
MQNVDSGILDREHKTPPFGRRDDRVDPIQFYRVHKPAILRVETNVSAYSKLMAVSKFGGVWPLQQQFTNMPVPERAGHERVPNALFVEASLCVEDLFGKPAKDVVGELIGAEQVVDRLVDPDIELDLSIVDIGLTDQVNAIERAKHVLGLKREPQVGIIIARPCFAIVSDEHFYDVIHHHS